MITPLMLVLSSINEKFEYDKPFGLSYLTSSDRTLLLSEAKRLGSIVSDEDVILYDTSPSGKQVVDTTQVVGDSAKSIHWATATLLTRFRDAYSVFSKSSTVQADEVDQADLGTDSVAMHIEGNPNYVYVYVLNMMMANGIDYDTKIAKIFELYDILAKGTAVPVGAAAPSGIERLEIHAKTSFWSGLLTSDRLSHGFRVTDPLSKEDFQLMRKELNDLGFYGFVNPHKMYMDFSGSRLNRKIEVTVDDEVLDFLEKVVKSGGVRI